MNKQPVQILENKAGRPAGSRNKRTILREALAATFADGEAGYWAAVCSQAKEGCTQSQALIANRLMPTLKPQSDCVTLPEPLTGTAAEQARQIIQYAGAGQIPPSTAQELLSALADVLRIVEITELEQRLQKLEETLTPPKEQRK